MPFRTLAVGAVLAGATAAVIAMVVARARPARVYAFMPGPLGRVVVPLRDSGSDFSESGRQRVSGSGPTFVTRSIELRAGAEADWGRQNGLTDSLWFIHNLVNVFPPELYAAHPEFFPFADGRRLDPPPGYNYWNPDLGREDVAQYAAAAAKQYFARHPDAVSFSLGVNDGLVFGESPETLRLIKPPRWFRGRPDYSRLVFTFMNRAAADLAKTYPDKYLGCLAYYWCENAPDFPVNPRVIPFLTADRAQSYDPAFVKEEFDLQARWARALRIRGLPAKHAKDTKLDRPGLQEGAEIAETRGSVSQLSTLNSQPAETRLQPRLGLYDYLDDCGFLVPRVPIHAFAEHLRHAREVGFTDYYGESSRNWGLDGPLPWVIAQLLQDPEQDVDRLLDVYYRNYFGPAAGPMRAFFERCEYQWMHQAGPSYWLKHYRNESQAKLFPPTVCRQLRQLLNEAAVAADGAVSNKRYALGANQCNSPDWDVIRQRVAFVSASFGVTERFVTFQYAREALARATLEWTVTASQLQAYVTARREFIRDSSVVTHQWPLAFYPIGYDDWLSDDPAFAAAYALAGRRAGNLTREILKPETVEGEGSDSPVVASAAIAAEATKHVNSPDLLANGSLEGALVPGRRIAGLQYGLDLPAPWQSKVEPMEHALGVISRSAARTGAQGLRISGAESTAVYQWLPATAGRLYSAAVMACGRVSPSAVVMLTVSWLDAHQHRIGEIQAMRLPEGRWPSWVELRQGGRAPAAAAWLGIGVRVEHQAGDDFVDVDDFSVRVTN